MSTAQRLNLLDLIEQGINDGARQENCCEIIGLSARTLQRWRQMQGADGSCRDHRPLRKQTPINQMTQAEREHVLATANSAQFADLPPSQIVPRLADQGVYLGSESTFYRVLRSEQQNNQRGNARAPKSIKKPKALRAEQPGQLFSWDITYLPTLVQGRYFYLYLFIDLYSRKIVGWQVYENESADKAAQLVKDICLREKIPPNQAVLHSDNGSPMKATTMLAMLQALGVIPSFSRPAVSNDNPYSEALFRTLKYHPIYPREPFTDLLQTRIWVGQFVLWYNEEHRHSALQFVTPNERHAGVDLAILNKRHALYQQARERHPQRWSGKTRNWEHKKTVLLNPEKQKTKQENRTTQKAA